MRVHSQESSVDGKSEGHASFLLIIAQIFKDRVDRMVGYLRGKVDRLDLCKTLCQKTNGARVRHVEEPVEREFLPFLFESQRFRRRPGDRREERTFVEALSPFVLHGERLLINRFDAKVFARVVLSAGTNGNGDIG